MGDPFAAVSTLGGVGSAAAHARDAVDVLLRHPVLRRGAGRVAAEVAVRCAQASAALQRGALAGGADADPPVGPVATVPAEPGAATGEPGDPLLQGALRVAAAVPTLAAVWERSPAQSLARLHVLAARDLVAGQPEADARLGRPRQGVERARLEQILALSTVPTAAPGVVVAAIVHAELLALTPFGLADEVVARAAERVVLVLRGVDPKAVCATDVGHAAHAATYRGALAGYVAGDVGSWVRHACDAYARGAEESLAVCERLRGGALR